MRLTTREEIKLSCSAEKHLSKVIYKHRLLHFNLQCSVFLPPNIFFERNFGIDHSLIYGSHIAQFLLQTILVERLQRHAQTVTN